MSDDELRASVLREAHRFIDEAANAAVTKLEKIRDGVARANAETLSYPPGDGETDSHFLTEEELKALGPVAQSEATVSALRKVLREAASSTLFHFLCLLDGVRDPQDWEGDVWLGADLVAPDEDAHREMLHDEFYERYWDYVSRKARC